MSIKTSVRLDSKIFNSPELKRALSKVPLQMARDFAKDLGVKMENSPHTGKVVTKSRGGNFKVRHQQSRRGERAAPFTRTLIRSIKARRNGDFSAVVDSDAPYADKLIFEDGRVIVSNEDLAQARKAQSDEVNSIISSFAK